MLSRWGGNNINASPTVQLKLLKISSVKITKPIDPVYRVQPLKNMVWPDTSEIFRVQQTFIPNSSFARNSDGLMVDTRNCVVIPVQSEDLRIRLCVIAHAGCNSGHLGYHTALNLLKDRVYWVGMEDDIRSVCASCLHCLPTRKGFRIPRPLGTACHGVKPNQVLHFRLFICCTNITKFSELSMAFCHPR